MVGMAVCLLEAVGIVDGPEKLHVERSYRPQSAGPPMGMEIVSSNRSRHSMVRTSVWEGGAGTTSLAYSPTCGLPERRMGRERLHVGRPARPFPGNGSGWRSF